MSGGDVAVASGEALKKKVVELAKTLDADPIGTGSTAMPLAYV